MTFLRNAQAVFAVSLTLAYILFMRVQRVLGYVAVPLILVGIVTAVWFWGV